MNTYFPITTALNRDSEVIINALTNRSAEIKASSQNLTRRVSVLALQMIGLAAAIVTVACLPTAAILFTVTVLPLKIAAISFVLAITGLGLSILFSPSSPGETIIKNQWKALFAALRQGDGQLILHTCRELAAQKQKRRDSFNSCLGPLPPDETTPFFHKTCLVGYLLIAMQHLRKGDREQSNTSAHSALSHFQQSGFPEEVRRFIKSYMDAPQTMQQHLKLHQHSQYPLHALDRILVNKLGIK